LCTVSSVGESGFMDIAALLARLMLRSWSATAFLGLSLPLRVGLPAGGVEAGRRAVFRSGMGGGCSRLRLGEGWKADSVMGGMLRMTITWGRSGPFATQCLCAGRVCGVC
jgi:hypothetical protein